MAWGMAPTPMAAFLWMKDNSAPLGSKLLTSRASPAPEAEKYPDQPVIFSLMEPDLEEEAIIERMYPPEFEDEIDALREAKERKAKDGKK